MISPASFPQKYSRDLYVRMRASELYQLQFVHLYSASLNTPVCPPIYGYTEWKAHHFDATVSLAWDWVLQDDGALLIAGPQQLRSNIMLVSAKGYDLGPEETAADCARVVETIPWQATVLTTQNCDRH